MLSMSFSVRACWAYARKPTTETDEKDAFATAGQGAIDPMSEPYIATINVASIRNWRSFGHDRER